jgi:hypothetical protein
MQSERIKWPNGKQFAFTIFDDTDHASMQNVPEIYQYLWELGIITTKSVWPLKGSEEPVVGGITCEQDEYLRWAQDLQGKGYEIALHNVTYHTSQREQIEKGLDQFKRHFGAYPNIQVNHVGCNDSLYWGASRLTGENRFLYNLLTRSRNNNKFGGHVPGSPLFWGDLVKEHVSYMRNFVYSDMNTLKACPYMPYHDPARPYVNNWFASSEGANCKSFCNTISEVNQDRLEEEGGACIMYTHLGAPDFFDKGVLSPRFKSLMARLSQKNGWFVPVSTLLDYMIEQRGPLTLTNGQRRRIEQKWLYDKMFVSHGTS